MKRKLEFSFDDEVVIKFCCDLGNKKIEIHFEGFYEVLGSHFIHKPCRWIIENWSNAKSKLSSESSYSNLEQHIGIVSLVLSVDLDSDFLMITVNTVDNRYVDLQFYSPQIRLEFS